MSLEDVQAGIRAKIAAKAGKGEENALLPQ